MDLTSFWAKTSGTWINAGTVLVGTLIGLGLADRLPERMRRVIVQGVGLVTLAIGFGMARELDRGGGGHVDGVVLGLLAIAGGGLLGGSGGGSRSGWTGSASASSGASPAAASSKGSSPPASSSASAP